MFVWNKNELNEEQEEAILQAGNVFLMACPGSGKTRALTYKIARQLSMLSSNKEWVVAITYTNRAADEIHDRIENLGVDTTRLWIGTIHSFCLEWILRPYAIYHNELKHGFTVINPFDAEQLLTDLCQPYKNPKITSFDCGHHYTSAGLVLGCNQAFKHTSIQKVLSDYHAVMRSRREIDFELILRYSYELIVSHPPISTLLSSLFTHILLDEYQDTKEIQYFILASIIKAGKNKIGVFVVGDPNQAIYGSLGGHAITAEKFGLISGIEFKQMELTFNYRSSERIVNYFGNYNIYATKINAVGQNKQYASVISFDETTSEDNLVQELIRLVRHNIQTNGISPNEVCILAPQWMPLAKVTRKLAAALPEYSFDGPGMVPFSRDIENFWYKLSRIVLTTASPSMYVRRQRWAGEVLTALDMFGLDITKISKKSLLRECNATSASVVTDDGLTYLAEYFDALFERLNINFKLIPGLLEHHSSFFNGSRDRIEKLRKNGAEFIADIATFKKVFESKNGITLSTIHGVKGTEYDVVIAFALLEGMVPNRADPEGQDSANKLLYVICSRARKNLHLISETGREDWSGKAYTPTLVLSGCDFDYDTVPKKP